jgi:hypothetical protein
MRTRKSRGQRWPRAISAQVFSSPSSSSRSVHTLCRLKSLVGVMSSANEEGRSRQAIGRESLGETVCRARKGWSSNMACANLAARGCDLPGSGVRLSCRLPRRVVGAPRSGHSRLQRTHSPQDQTALKGGRRARASEPVRIDRVLEAGLRPRVELDTRSDGVLRKQTEIRSDYRCTASCPMVARSAKGEDGAYRRWSLQRKAMRVEGTDRRVGGGE